MDTGIADHMFVGVTLKYSHVIPKRVSFTVRNMKKLDYIKLQSELQNCSFITCPVDDVDGFVDQMCSDVISVLDVLAPKHKTTKRVGKQHQFRLSSDAEKAKQHRRTCEKRYRESRSETDRKNYRAACRDANRLITKSHQEHFKNKLESAKGDQRSTWRTANEILHRGDEQRIDDPV